MRNRVIRFVLVGLMACVWLVVIALAAEVCTRVYVLASERLYASFFEEQNKKVYRMVSKEEPEVAIEGAAPSDLRVSPSSGVSTPDAAANVCVPDEVERDSYAKQSDESQAVIDTVRGQVRARFSAALELETVTGDPLFVSRFREWSASRGGIQFHDSLWPAMQSLQRGQSTGWLPGVFDSRYPLEAMATLVEGHYPNPDRVDVVVREVPPVLLSPVPPVPESHSTDIPGIRYKRNWYVEGEIASYNNYGFRDDDVVMPKPAGLFRIVCIGGSTTEEGNNNRETYPNQVERKLQQVYGKDKVEVINCGISGITSYHERRRIEDFLELDPDLIVYYNGVNDACHEHTRLWLEEARKQGDWMLRSKLLTRFFNTSLLPSDDYLRDFMRRTTFRNLRAMAYRARECGVGFAICSFATPGPSHLGMRDRIFLDMNLREVYHGQYLTYPSYRHFMGLHNELVRETCDTEKLPYIPVAERLDVGMDHFFDLCHMTPVGLEEKSSIIADELKKIVDELLKATRT